MADDLHGKTIILTGGSAGIGAAAVRELRRRGATVAMTGRSPATMTIAAETGADPYLVDFGSFAAVRDFAAKVLAKYPRIDALVNNVGGLISTRRVTADGHEQTFQTNHLSGFLLTELLRERIGASGGRVIDTSSRANIGGRLDFDDLEHAKGYRAFRAYGDAKLMNILHIMEFARRNPNIPSASFHPGVVATDFARDGGRAARMFYEMPLFRPFLISPEKGADTLIWLLTSQPGRDWVSGEFYSRRKIAGRNRRATPENARRLWDISEKLVGLR